MSDKKNRRTQKDHSPRAGSDKKGGPPEKPTNFKGTFFRLVRYLKPYSTKLIIVFLAAVVSTVFMILGPKIMGDAVTELFEGAYGGLTGAPGGGIDFGAIGKILLILGSLYVISSLFNYIQQFTMAGVAQGTVFDLREDVNLKLEKLQLKYYDNHPVGDTLSRMTNDIDLIGNTLQQSITQFITSMITIVGILFMMFWISPMLAIISLVSLPISFFVIRPFLK